MLAPIKMTFHTVLEIRDAFLAMLRSNIRFVMLVTTVAGIGRKVVRVTGLAVAISISMPKRKSMDAIVGGRFPGTRGMAGSTVCTELTGVFLRLSMTVYTRIHCRDAIMVKGGIFPTGWIVAGFALCSVPAVMIVVNAVAGITIPRGVFENTIYMAFFTGSFSVFSFQPKSGEIMVKIRILPRAGVVTGLAIRPIPAIVLIVPRMTGITILRCRLKVGYRTRIEMAFGTGDALRMSAFEFEGIGIMVEIFKTVHTVVASQTLPAKRKNMSLGEGNIHVAVTGPARV